MPKEFFALVDWESFYVEKISGINEALAERREDVLYRIEEAGKPVCFSMSKSMGCPSSGSQLCSSSLETEPRR